MNKTCKCPTFVSPCLRPFQPAQAHLICPVWAAGGPARRLRVRVRLLRQDLHRRATRPLQDPDRFLQWHSWWAMAVCISTHTTTYMLHILMIYWCSRIVLVYVWRTNIDQMQCMGIVKVLHNMIPRSLKAMHDAGESHLQCKPTLHRIFQGVYFEIFRLFSTF